MTLQQFVCEDPEVMSGIPCLRGHRIPFARILAEIADGMSLLDIADEFDLSPELLRGAFRALAKEWEGRNLAGQQRKIVARASK